MPTTETPYYESDLMETVRLSSDLPHLATLPVTIPVISAGQIIDVPRSSGTLRVRVLDEYFPDESNATRAYGYKQRGSWMVLVIASNDMPNASKAVVAEAALRRGRLIM